MLELGVLGELVCTLDGQPVEIGSRRQRVLLASLAAGWPEPRTTDRLIDDLWSTAELPARPNRALQTIVSRLRSTLSADGDDRVPRTATGYRLAIGADELDAARFERLVADADDLPTADARASLTTALDLWRGQPYHEFDDLDFAATEAARLGDVRIVAAERLAHACLDLGDAHEAAAVASTIVDAHPLREAALGTLMRARYAQGRQQDALDRYRTYRLALAGELGLDPSPALVRLERDILEHQLDQPTTLPLARPATSVSTLTVVVAEVVDEHHLGEAHATEMSEVLTRHADILRAEFAAAGGETSAWGSTRLAVTFPTAPAAVDAAIAALRALADETWPEPLAPTVRIGMHTGAATAGPGGLTGGSAAHRAERLMHAAHGGQVLVSAATGALLDGVAAEAGLVDLGRHRLAELAAPELVFQLVADGIRRDFPPVIGSDVAGNLPAAVDELVGRSPLVEHIAARSVAARVVTISGSPGIGKSRLAIEVARRIGPRFDDGVWLCELAGATDTAGAEESLASSIGAQVAGGASFAGALADRIGPAEMLLVVDNCEHLLDVVAPTVDTLVRGCPRLIVLTTSREALGVAGEHVVTIPPLDADHAQRLFVERATARRDGFDAGDHADAIAEICDLLDGIPLAIELAASLVGTRSPREILARLRTSQLVIEGSDRRVERHRTLRSAIEWSYGGLDEAAATLFDRLSVFAGSFDADAATIVCAGDELDATSIPAALDDLVLKSLVTALDTGLGMRFHQFEAIRECGAHHLAAQGEFDRARRAHLAHYTRVGHQLRGDAGGSRQAQARLRFEAEYTNLRAALRTAIELQDADAAVELATIDDSTRQLTSRILGWSSLALAVPGADRTPRRAIAAASASFAAMADNADPEAAQRWLDQGFEWLGEDGVVADPYLYGIEGLLAVGRGDYETVRRAGEDAIRLAREIGNEPVLVWELASHALYTAATPTGVDRAESLRFAEEAVDIARRIGNAAVLDFALAQLAWLLHRRDPDRAAMLRDEGLALVSSPVAEGLQASGRAILAVDRGEEPAPYLHRGNRIVREHRDLQVEHPMLLAALAWVVVRERADLAARILAAFGEPPTPWMLLRRAALDRERAEALVERDLDAARAVELRSAGASVSAAVLIDLVLDELG